MATNVSESKVSTPCRWNSGPPGWMYEEVPSTKNAHQVFKWPNKHKKVGVDPPYVEEEDPGEPDRFQSKDAAKPLPLPLESLHQECEESAKEETDNVMADHREGAGEAEHLNNEEGVGDEGGNAAQKGGGEASETASQSAGARNAQAS